MVVLGAVLRGTTTARRRVATYVNDIRGQPGAGTGSGPCGTPARYPPHTGLRRGLIEGEAVAAADGAYHQVAFIGRVQQVDLGELEIQLGEGGSVRVATAVGVPAAVWRPAPAGGCSGVSPRPACGSIVQRVEQLRLQHPAQQVGGSLQKGMLRRQPPM